MIARLSSTVGVAKDVAAVAKKSDVTFLAASLAYYAFLSLIPTVVLALAVATTFGGERLASVVVAATEGFLTESGQEVLNAALTESGGAGGATVLGVVILLWGALKVFRALDIAFSKVYDAESENTFLDQVVDSLVVLGSIGLTLVFMFVFAAVLAALQFGLVFELASVLVLPVLLTGAFLPIYYRFPDTAVTVREALPGAIFAAVGWTALQGLFQIYASAAGATAYGIVGGVILLVTWLYIAGAVLLVGAVLNVVLAGRIPAEFAGEGEASDRQFQGDWESAFERMSEEREPRGAPDVADLAERVEQLQAEVDRFEEDVEERTVDRPQLEADLKRYVRSRVRRGKARGWGPYLVLLYGTAMSLGAFYWLEGWVTIAAMFVAFTSALGVYIVFALFGGVLGAFGAALGLVDRLRSR